MKIYINNYDFTEIDKSLQYDNKYYNDLIYTPTDILLRENDDFLWKTKLINNTYETHESNNITFIIDYTEFTKTEKIYNIPKEHFHIKEYVFEYEINEHLMFIKKQLHDQTNYYFQVKDKDSFSFEDLFNFIK
jgi:hypothetical protein